MTHSYKWTGSQKGLLRRGTYRRSRLSSLPHLEKASHREPSDLGSAEASRFGHLWTTHSSPRGTFDVFSLGRGSLGLRLQEAVLQRRS